MRKIDRVLRMAVATMCVATVGLEIGMEERSREDAPPFLDPATLNRTLCSGTVDGTASRRAFFIRVAQARAQQSSAKGADFATDMHYPVTVSTPRAQTLFDQGLAQMTAFNHGAAVERFRAAQTEDPACAMCFWGEALSLGPNINAPMMDENYAPARAAAARAQALAMTASPVERALIGALANRYGTGTVEDRFALDVAYADAMDAVASAHPDDATVAVLAAEANMDTEPWQYWETDGRTPTARAAKSLERIERVLARDPDNAAATHLYIHLTEASVDPFRAEPFADRMAARGSALGHMVHMPSHTYYRVGRYEDSLKTNIKAIRADEAMIARGTSDPFYQNAYYTHNLHFALTSATMGGDRGTALAMADKLDRELPLEFARAVPFVQPVKAAPLFARVQFEDWSDILSRPAPGADLPYLQAIWHYARGEAFAAKGDGTEARAELDALKAIAKSTDYEPYVAAGVPAEGVLGIAQSVLDARIADANGDLDRAIAHLEDAADAQAELPYMEPPFWHMPVNQSLAAALLRDGQAERAQALFMRTLVESPNNGWASFGLAESYAAMGNRRAARYARELYKQSWFGLRRGPSLAQF